MTDLGPAGVVLRPRSVLAVVGPRSGPSFVAERMATVASALSDKQRREMRQYVRYESQFCRSAGCGFRHRPGVTPCLTAAALEEQDAIRREESSRRRAATAAEDAEQSK